MKSTVQSLKSSIRNSAGNLGLANIKVLLVGNNPMELGQCCRSLINYRNNRFNIETAFSSEECYKKSLKFKPAAIIVEDSVGFMKMIEIIEKLHKDARFTKIPVIVIKNSNYHHETLNEGVTEFIMIDRVLNGELPEAVINSVLNKTKTGLLDEKVIPSSFEKKISRLLFSIFTSNKISAS